MSNTIQNMLYHHIGDGARGTKYECLVTFPSFISSTENTIVLGKSAQFPSLQTQTIEYKHKGKVIPLKGQTRYNNILIMTFHLTEDHKLRQDFIKWQQEMDIHYMETPTLGSNNYTQNIRVAQLNFAMDEITAVYEYKNAFPVSVSQTELDYADVGRILEFTVEFAYSHFTMGKVTNGNINFVDSITDFLSGMTTLATDYVTNKANEIFNQSIDSGLSIANDFLGGFLEGTPLSDYKNLASGSAKGMVNRADGYDYISNYFKL